MTSVESRLRRLEGNCFTDAAIIEKMIREGKFYDELTDEEKQMYERYKESWGNVAADIAGARLESVFDELREDGRDPFHFPLTQREKALTPEEHAQRVEEVQRLFEKIRQETAIDDPTF